MMSPDCFGRTHKRHMTDVIRVALERRGILGFIEIHDTMTLIDARALISENVENAPVDFQFVLDDGTPVSGRQELTQKIFYFYPCVKIRECKRSGINSVTKRATMGTTAVDQDSGGTRETSGSLGTTDKISVWTASGDEFTVWISEDYTFQQLRRDAARYWNLPPSQVALVDGEGCLWPEQARILSVMNIAEIQQRRIILESIAGATGDCKAMRRQDSWSRNSRNSHSSSKFTRRNSLKNSSQTSQVNPAEALWQIFTYYCVTGDILDLECIRAHQFNRLLRDSRILSSSFTPAMVTIIYTSETKGKPQASGKMSYDEFLNALVKVAVARQQKASSRHLRDGQDEDTLFHRLVNEQILPLASRWPTELWQTQTETLRALEIVGFVSKFLDALLDIFMFYAKTHWLNAATGSKEFYMGYTDFQRFVNDFALANLHVSSVEAAQVYLAACSSPPFHDAFTTTGRESGLLSTSHRLMREGDDDEVLSALTLYEEMNPSDDAASSCSSAVSVTLSIQRSLASAEGIVVFAPPDVQIGRLCMSFSAFLDALGRMGLASFTKTKTVKPLQAVKAVFHHLSRGLTRSRVLEILHNHGSTSIHSAKFYSGSVAFSNKFLDMWRYEGSPDYLTGSENTNALALSLEKPISSGVTTPSAVQNGSNGVPAVPLSPSKRLNSSAALYDERVVQNGVGRGREALDRLVRNAFIRNALQANNQTKSDEVQSTSLVLPSSDEATRTPSITHHAMSPDALPVDVGSTPLAPDTIEKLTICTEALEGEQWSTVTDQESSQASPPPPPSLSAIPGKSVNSMNVTLRPDDEKALYESILLKGGVFKKYGQWGNPHRRFVWCSKEFDGIYWRPINKKFSLSKDGIPVSSLIAVLPGNSTRTRYAFMKHLSEEKSLSRCLSLVAEDRRLDLEADSEATRDLWMKAFVFLMKEHRPRIR